MKYKILWIIAFLIIVISAVIGRALNGPSGRFHDVARQALVDRGELQELEINLYGEDVTMTVYPEKTVIHADYQFRVRNRDWQLG